MKAEVERMSSRSHPLEGIQALRAIAALIVVLHHALEESMAAAVPFSPDWFTTFGAAGVDIFFVISGFIMLYVSFPDGRAAASPASFLIKRITRIYPFYWFCVALVLGLWTAGFYRSLPVDTETLIRSMLLFPGEHLVIGVAWTLVYEMYFYLVFAATLVFRKPLVSLLGTSATILILSGIGHLAPDPAVRAFLTNPIALEFCFGLILAYVHQRWSGSYSAVRLLWIPGFAMLMLSAWLVPHIDTNGLPGGPRVLAWGIPAVLITLSFLSVKPSSTPFRQIMVLLGDASYAIYLSHPFVMIAYAKLLRGSLATLPQLPLIPLVVLLSASLGLLLHYFVERRLILIFRGLFGLRSSSFGLKGPRPTTPS
jgi:peptidoglycan/LPS O-acetylase OafA/YrhL